MNFNLAIDDWTELRLNLKPIPSTILLAHFTTVAKLMFHPIRQTAKTLLPQSLRTTVRGGLRPIAKWWTRSPLAAYLAHRRADIYLISFPRSGRTWLRTMLGTALCDYFGLDIPAPELIAELWTQHPRIPSIRLDHKAIRLERPDQFKHKKIILLVRNPLDIGVSQYHFKQRLGELDEPVFNTVQNVVTSYNAWAIFMQDHPNCLMVKYEELLATPHTALESIFQFMGLPEVANTETLQRTVEACSLTNLKQLSNDPTRSLFHRPEQSPIVRSGKSGSSKNELNQSTYEELKQFVMQTLNKDFNYPLNI